MIALSSLLFSLVLLSSRSPPATVTMGRAPAWGFTCTFTGKLQLAQKPWTLLILEKTPASSAALLPKRLSHSCANFLKPAYRLKRDCFQKITLPSSFWRQLKFPGKKKKDRTKRTKILDSTDENFFFYPVQERPTLFWRKKLCCNYHTLLLLFSITIFHSFPPSPRGTNRWRDEGESQDKDKY